MSFSASPPQSGAGDVRGVNEEEGGGGNEEKSAPQPLQRDFFLRASVSIFLGGILRPPMPAPGAPQGEREGENQKRLILAQKAFL